MTYVLENTAEAKRLKLQDDISVYSLTYDLMDLLITEQHHVLDAGCGAGVVSLFLKNNFRMKQLDSCDFSELRLKQAQKYLKENNHHDVAFYQCDLEKVPKEDNLYDRVVCRFVYEYLARPEAVTREFYRVCRPGGQVRLIDLDGVVANLQTSNKELQKMLTVLTHEAYEKHHLDFYAGRKIYTHMMNTGFKNVEYKVRPMVFKNDDLVKEVENYRERFSFGRPLLDSVFGVEQAQKFIDLYLSEMLKKDAVLFYNNFIVTGTK